MLEKTHLDYCCGKESLFPELLSLLKVDNFHNPPKIS